jgi:epsilon-lactone hydrolase
MSWQLKALRVVLRRFVRPALRRQRDSLSARKWFERGAFLNARGRPYLHFAPDILGKVPALWTARPAQDAPDYPLFPRGRLCHGKSAHPCGPCPVLSRKSGLQTCLPDYRLAPEHPFPAAFVDALCAWDALAARGITADKIALGGDSAGGGLALALLAHLCANRAAAPGLRFCLLALCRSYAVGPLHHRQCTARNPAACATVAGSARARLAGCGSVRSAHLAAIWAIRGRAACAAASRAQRNFAG